MDMIIGMNVIGFVYTIVMGLFAWLEIRAQRGQGGITDTRPYAQLQVSFSVVIIYVIIFIVYFMRN